MNKTQNGSVINNQVIVLEDNSFSSKSNATEKSNNKNIPNMPYEIIDCVSSEEPNSLSECAKIGSRVISEESSQMAFSSSSEINSRSARARKSNLLQSVLESIEKTHPSMTTTDRVNRWKISLDNVQDSSEDENTTRKRRISGNSSNISEKFIKHMDDNEDILTLSSETENEEDRMQNSNSVFRDFRKIKARDKIVSNKIKILIRCDYKKTKKFDGIFKVPLNPQQNHIDCLNDSWSSSETGSLGKEEFYKYLGIDMNPPTEKNERKEEENSKRRSLRVHLHKVFTDRLMRIKEQEAQQKTSVKSEQDLIRSDSMGSRCSGIVLDFNESLIIKKEPVFERYSYNIADQQTTKEKIPKIIYMVNHRKLNLIVKSFGRPYVPVARCFPNPNYKLERFDYIKNPIEDLIEEIEEDSAAAPPTPPPILPKKKKKINFKMKKRSKDFFRCSLRTKRLLRNGKIRTTNLTRNFAIKRRKLLVKRKPTILKPVSTTIKNTFFNDSPENIPMSIVLTPERTDSSNDEADFLFPTEHKNKLRNSTDSAIGISIVSGLFSPATVLPENITNQCSPVDDNMGPVISAYFMENILILIQEQQVSFWKHLKIMSILGVPSEWKLIAQTERKRNDIEINSEFQKRICFNENSPVYMELRAKHLHSDTVRECDFVQMYANVYFLNKKDENDTNLIKKSIHLDTLHTQPSHISYTTLPNSRYFVIGWVQHLFTKNISGICKYSLSPDLETLASIREFSDIKHDVNTMECIKGLFLRFSLIFVKY